MKFSFLEGSPSRSVPERARPKVSSRPRLSGPDAKLTQHCVRRLAELGLGELMERVTVEWNTRMRSCAGRAFWPKGVIQLNPKLVEISKAEVRQTLLHELAHLVAYERNQHRAIKSHGVEWQEACADVGIPGEKATHELPLPTRSLKRQWRYECPECAKVIDRVRRYQGVVACYDCCLTATGGVYHESFQLKEIRLSEVQFSK